MKEELVTQFLVLCVYGLGKNFGTLGWFSWTYFICSLFNDTVSSSDYIVSNDMMINELERMCKGSGHGSLRYYPIICLKGLRKTSVRIASLWAEFWTQDYKFVRIPCCYYQLQKIETYKFWVTSDDITFIWNLIKIRPLVFKLKHADRHYQPHVNSSCAHCAKNS
jgi:hypothetical protein